MSQVRTVRKSSFEKKRAVGKSRGKNRCKVSKNSYIDLNVMKTILWLRSRRRVDRQPLEFSNTSELGGRAAERLIEFGRESQEISKIRSCDNPVMESWEFYFLDLENWAFMVPT